jgi:pyruvate/2-oxoglutarate dehydrogenase complex dihydrolipoamide acyltransferase (E2) component
VAFSSWYFEYGLMVVIDHGNGQETRYGHASALLVKPDEVVQAGQVIARVGCTGACTAPHVHFEIRIDGQAINPLAPLAAASSSPTPGNSVARPAVSGVRRPHARRSDQEQLAGSRVRLFAPEDDDNDEGDY